MKILRPLGNWILNYVQEDLLVIQNFEKDTKKRLEKRKCNEVHRAVHSFVYQKEGVLLKCSRTLKINTQWLIRSKQKRVTN